MRKYLGLFLLLLFLNGCNDGDVTVESISFDQVNAQRCSSTSDVIYKVKGNEALFLKIPVAEAFLNEVTPVGSPRVFQIGGNVIVRYRSYSGNVTSESICPDVVQPIAPIATLEWIATAGTVEITTTAIQTTPDPITGATKPGGFNHNIVFRNIVFSKPVGQQIYTEFVFGDFATGATTLPLAFPKENVHLCPSGTTLYNAADGGSEGMFIQNLDPALLSTATLNVPKTGLISDTTNKLTYRLLSTALLPLGSNDAYYCSSPLPATPAVTEEWFAENGVSGVSGIIEVTTTTNGPSSFLHTIHLKGVTFRKGEMTFYFGNDIIWGELITTN